MQAMVIEKYGKNVPLIQKKMPTPPIGDHDVLVEIHAASLNPIDYKIKEGKVGKQVNAYKPGDEVYGRPRKDRIGTLAEYIAVHEETSR